VGQPVRQPKPSSQSLEDLPLGIEKLERQDGNPIRILVRP